MSVTVADISMSLDGFVTGPDPGVDRGLGRGGEAIQQWVFSSHDSPEDRLFLESAGEATGAVVMGRHTFDFVDGPGGWDDEVNYSYDHETVTRPPVFVVTHRAPKQAHHTDGFTFVTDGLAAAVHAARKAASTKETVLMGGASVIDQALNAGLVDLLRIHLSPVLMGSGTSLFDLVDRKLTLTQRDVVVTPNATHLTYEVG